ncbi:hypothetical protein D3C76_1118790 [compost metagenome]
MGNVTLKNVCHPFAPKVKAASSSAVPKDCIRGINSLATNGIVTNVVAIIIPGGANIIFILLAFRKSAKRPWLVLKSNTNINPAITGEIAKGISKRVSKILFPLNSNLPNAQDAAKPNIVFIGTATNTVNKVSFNASNATGSVIALIYKSKPFSKAFANTAIKGIMSSSVKYISAIEIRIIFVNLLSSVDELFFCLDLLLILNDTLPAMLTSYTLEYLFELHH